MKRFKEWNDLFVLLLSMRKQYLCFTLLSFVLFFTGCSKDDNVMNEDTPEDTPEKPEIVEKRENYAADIYFIDTSKVDSVSIKNDTTIVIYSNTHFKDDLKVGEKFVYSKDNTAEDYFVGIIKSIKTSGKTYTIHTEIPSFSEIFSELNLTPEFKNENVVAEFVPDDEDNVIYNGIVDNSIWEEIETIYCTQDSTTSTRTALDREASLPIDFTHSFTAKPNQAFSGDIYLRLKGHMHIYDGGNYELNVQKTVGLKGSFGLATKSIDRQYIPLLKTKNGITLFSKEIVVVKLNPSLNFFYRGEIKLEAGFKYELINADNYVSYKNGTFTSKSFNNLKDSYFRVKNLHTEAEFGISLNADLYAFIFTEKFFKGGLKTVAGVAISGEHNVGIQFPDFANFDFQVSFSPFLEITPFVAIWANTLKPFEGPTLKVNTETFKIDLLPNIHEINYKKKQKELRVNSKIENEKTSFLETKENGIALFKKGEEKPVAYEKTNSTATSAVSSEVVFEIEEDKDYEIARYAKAESGQEVYGERISVDNESLKEALIKLYQSTNGDNWTRNDNWCSDKPITEWYGITKLGENQYTLLIFGNNLTGGIDQTFPDDVNIKLFCGGNQLTYLNVSGCTALELLNCSNNQLTSLDVSGCTALKNLNCGGNQLTSLDVSSCTALEILFCSGNQLTSLDVSSCTVLEYLSCGENQLTSLDFSGCTALKDFSCDGNQLTSLDVSGYTALETLGCSYNQLTSLDVSGCTALKNLNCRINQLPSLDVSSCTALETLSCGYNQLPSLDVSGCTSLEHLNCEENQLPSLDVSGCTVLEILYCSGNQLPSLDVSSCTVLEYLSCDENQLTSLDVSDCTALKNLYCDENQLTSLDVSNCTVLEYLSCDENQLTSLDVSDCTALEYLFCVGNQLASLNASGCTALTELEFHGNNQLASLNVSGCTALTELELYSNNQLTSLNASGCTALTVLNYNITEHLTSLDISGCTALTELELYSNNQLASLNASGCTALTVLNCAFKQLTSLNVSGCTALTELEFHGNNQLASLDVSGCTLLTELHYSFKQLTSLDVSGCTSLTKLSCSHNQLTSLNVSGCTALRELSCENNKIKSIIPAWFSQLKHFSYDVRYRYSHEYIDGKYVKVYEDNGYGWWYPGEPGKGEHSPD